MGRSYQWKGPLPGLGDRGEPLISVDRCFEPRNTQVGCLSAKAGYCSGALIGAGGSAKASRGEIVSRMDRTVSSVP